MKSPLIIWASLALVLFSCVPKKPAPFTLPAEWEPHAAIWIGWEDFPYYQQVTRDIIHALLPDEKVILAGSPETLAKARKYLASQDIDTTLIAYASYAPDRYWIRDHGPLFLTNGKDSSAVADFGWSWYGYPGWQKEKFPEGVPTDKSDWVFAAQEKDPVGTLDSLIGAQYHLPIRTDDVIIEGGAIEVNGKGTLILCEAVVFQRNPGRSKAELEAHFRHTLGVTNIIWMKQGLADDPHLRRTISGRYIGFGTGGHTDEFVRFANPNTLLLAWENEPDKNPIARMNHDRMAENLKILEAARDQDGKPFRIVKVPLPDLIARNLVVKEKDPNDDSQLFHAGSFLPTDPWQAGDTLLQVAASSYLNFLITNKKILLPTYRAMMSSSEKEDEVGRIFKELFPDRELVWIFCMPLNWEGGGIHCATMQEPVGVRP